jgi:predicted nucleotidyltransferase
MTKTAIQITDSDMAIYRATARRREEQKRQEHLQRGQRAQVVAQQATRLLKEQFEARRVILFGSLARRDYFHPRSDIDLAVEGIRPQDFWRAWGTLDTLGTEFEIDLIDLDSTSATLRLEIEREGVEL